MKHIACIIGWIGLSVILYGELFAQCNNQLVDSALARAGQDAIYMRDFKVKFGEGTMENPVPVGSYMVWLNKDVKYRFTVANAEEFPGNAIIHLYKRNQLLGSTYDTDKSVDNQQFDFSCPQTARYQVLISFNEGKEGCAAGVLSMILKDTTDILDPAFTRIESNQMLLYTDIINKINLVDTEGDIIFAEPLQGEGKVEKNRGFYELNELVPGELDMVIKTQTPDRLKTDTMTFKVIELPLPLATLDGMSGGLINKTNFRMADKLTLSYVTEVSPPLHTIESFTVSDEKNGVSGYYSDKENLTLQQKAFVEQLPTGSTFYITDIKVQDKAGKVFKLKPLAFIVD